MLYWLSDIFDIRLFQYLTFRAGLAVLIALMITLVFGKKHNTAYQKNANHRKAAGFGFAR